MNMCILIVNTRYLSKGSRCYQTGTTAEVRGGAKLDLDNPKTFNEKIQWIKLNDIDELKTRTADKYLVRDWVKEKIGGQYLIPLLGVNDSPDEIDYDKLPDQFVIKCNHGSGWNIIVKDKNSLDKIAVKNKLNTWLKQTYGVMGFEMQYAHIKPKIIIEKKIENNGFDDLFDYKIFCFSGNPLYIEFMFDRFKGGKKSVTYNREWQKQPFSYDAPMADKDIEKPDNLEQILDLAEKLSQGFKFVRVDLYRLNDGTIYFGEMTYTPMGGTARWHGVDMGIQFGDLIKLK